MTGYRKFTIALVGVIAVTILGCLKVVGGEASLAAVSAMVTAYLAINQTGKSNPRPPA